MEAIGLNPIRLDRIGLDPIRVNAIKLGVPGTASGSARPYIDPEVLASLVAVCICDGKSNNDPDRAVIKNLVDPDNPFVISNAAYKLNSGYGKYEEDFTTWRISKPGIVSTINVNSIHITRIESSLTETHAFFENVTTTKKFNIKLKISGLTSDMKCTLNNQNSIMKELVNGVNEISVDLVAGWYGFMITTLDGSIIGDCDITITQIPSFEGAFVTDGIDDLITSTKTVQEMLGRSNKCTVISLITHISGSGKYNIIGNGGIQVSDYSGQSFMAGCSSKSGEKIVELGDKEKLKALQYTTFDSKISIGLEDSSYAYYGTFVFNKDSVPIDWIHQVISYFNLDKHVKPDVYYDVKKQGLSNDTPEADWYLKDFSGNGHDMQLYNFAKKLGSGIGKYEVDFNTWIPQSYVADSTYTSNKLHITNIKGGNAILYTKKGANAMKVKITGIQSFNLVYRYIAENDVWEALKVDRDGIYELPASTTTTKTYYTGFTVPYYTGDCDITIEQIPDYEGALVSDGIDDYGYADNLPIYKDYTVAIDRAWTNDLVKDQCLTGKLNGNNFGSFSFELIENGFSSYSFSISNKGVITIDSNKKISYQSKYVYNGSPIISGNNVDGKDLFLFRNRDSYPYYAEAAIWSYILFPYTLSEFLLERQLKRYKLGTLYPNMVEFRPVISRNIPYNAIEISQGSTTLYNKSINKTGIYLQEGSTVRVYIQPSGIDEVSKITINGIEYTDLPINPNGFYYADFPITKSPQKISYAIDEYIRFEDIVQPYPVLLRFKDENGNEVSWGGKFRVGSTITRIGNFYENNLIDGLYIVRNPKLNGNNLITPTHVVEKSMVFTCDTEYLLDNNEPSCILSPNRLRIPNSSYKILGYIPDLTGKGNHGKLNNFAYTEDSGVASDGSIKIDGTDDHITISNIIGGKCIMAKVTVNRNSGIIYDQRRANVPNKSWMQLNPSSVIFEQNAVSTYIDGILNHNVTGSDLVSKTVNLTCELEIGDTSGTYQPTIGSSYAVGYTTDINLYEFMLFPDVPDEEEIKELNDVMGIENNIEVS